MSGTAQGTLLTPAQVLELLPQKPPFRFLDELLEIDDLHAVGRYTFKEDEHFYAGHFPGNPITPGVILVESMCQTGVVALGIYLLAQELPLTEVAKYQSLFTDAELEFTGIVRPGTTVTTVAEKVFFRRKKLRATVSMSTADGTVVASGVVSGLGVKQ
jgi:3-hydroxyacyl-[acyl-carrier-protein] dehydratase